MQVSQKIKEWWVNLSQRDKRRMGIVFALLVIFIGYAGIWAPFLQHVTTLRQRIAAEQQTLLWMQAADKKIQQIESRSKGKRQPMSPVVLLSFLQQQVQKAAIASTLVQFKQVGPHSVVLQFGQVDFDKLMRLLIAIHHESVAVKQLSVVGGTILGVVKADVMLDGG